MHKPVICGDFNSSELVHCLVHSGISIYPGSVPAESTVDCESLPSSLFSYASLLPAVRSLQYKQQSSSLVFLS